MLVPSSSSSGQARSCRSKIHPKIRSYQAMKATTAGWLLLWALVASYVHVVICGSSSLCGNETDRLSLLDFKDAISLDPQHVFMSWNDSTHFCNWEGVFCRVKSPRRVTSLNLTSRGLVGHISLSLGNLSFLHSLGLMENVFTGEIPPSLGHLQRLQKLRLGNNKLQGRIPSFTNCSKLSLLDVSNNNLVGPFPANFPSNLQILQISHNNLSGTIPTSLANITALKGIDFRFNHIVGNIPSEFAAFSSLNYLYAAVNQLTGSFPPAILNISTLIGFALAFNGLSGEVPPNLCTSLTSLRILILDGNFFLGHIPSSLKNASSLNNVDLSSNNFTGIVPTMGKLSKLSWLNLENNQLHTNSREDWEFLESLGNCTELRMLSISSNHLSGHIPSSIGNLSDQLERLYMANNQLSGYFPSGIANLHSLIIVSLDWNYFTGVVPQWIGTLNNLQKLGLDKNYLTGVLPSSLSNLSRLGGLYLYSNQFIGTIPQNFGAFPMLQELDISTNNLHGSVPLEIFNIPTISTIDLSFNNLNGKLPTDVGSAKQLVHLVLSSNNLSGDIPNTLGDCESLEDIELDSNIFSGSIPVSLGNITSLKVLNISTNNLTGEIPAALCNLQLLEKLDLSFNHLHGEIPTKGIFKNPSDIRIDGNEGLCGGALELHVVTCPVMPSASPRHREYLLLKIIIPIASMASLSMVIFGLMQWRGKQKSKPISLPSFTTRFPKVSFNDLARATQGFSMSNLIGSGRYSHVYRGKLVEGGNEVAVKVFKLDTRGAEKSFIAECSALINVRHRNLVPIITACSSIDSNGNAFKALVYDFMAGGDLHKLLYSTQENEGSSDLYLITMAQRINIVLDLANALEYLHHNNQGTMVHSDIKPSNILLDDNMTAHVGDFGLAQFKVGCTTSTLGSQNSSSVGLMGTIGYVAPEYAVGGQVSTSADVYSFGVVLLEIFLRRRPTDEMFKDGLSIISYTQINMPDRVLQIADPQLIDEMELGQETPTSLDHKGIHSLLSMLNIGICCTKLSPSERINMQEVAAKLHGIRDGYLRGN